MTGLPSCGVASGNAGTRHEGPHLWGIVGNRVPGSNSTAVSLYWQFDCAGEQGAQARFRWVLHVRRLLPKPELTVLAREVEAGVGSISVTLPPGLYWPIADPFRCQIFGGGSAEPTIGETFVVPDHCAWTVYALTGRAYVKRPAGTTRLDVAAVVRPGDQLETVAGAQIELGQGPSVLRLEGGARLRIEHGSCAVLGGWRVRLVSGRLLVTVAPNVDPRARHEIETHNAICGRGSGRWSVETAVRRRRHWTRVRVETGVVPVRASHGPRPHGRLLARASDDVIVAAARIVRRPL
jgi:hypothetical protein